MAYDISVGSANRAIRKEVVDNIVKQVAMRSYKFKQAVAVVSTSADRHVFYRENPDTSSQATGNDTEGIPRGANFPQTETTWEEASVRVVKFGDERNIPWEDIISGDVNVQARIVIRSTERVTRSVDNYILKKITNDFFSVSGDTFTGYTGSNGESLKIQSYAVGTGIAGSVGGRWNETSAAIVSDIMGASRLIAEANYDTGDLMCFISPKDKQSIMRQLESNGAQFPMIAADIVKNGNIGSLAGVKLIETLSMPASYALLVKPKTCATYQQLVGIRSVTKEDEYKSLMIRVVEEGCLELTDPKCVVLIKNTQAG